MVGQLKWVQARVSWHVQCGNALAMLLELSQAQGRVFHGAPGKKYPERVAGTKAHIGQGFSGCFKRGTAC